MTEKADVDGLAKKIKKNIYGKPQIIQVIFPAGMGKAALDEMTFILNHLWIKQKYTSELSLLKNYIRIDPIHLFAVTELLMRSQSIADIRLVIFEGMASGKDVFRKKCLGIHWNYFINKKMSLKIKVNSVASRAFHESALKEIVSDILKDHVTDIVNGENTTETTTLFVDLYKNKLTISISLAGSPLYKRGYRQMLSASAPLREDTAFCCLKRALEFAKKIDDDYMPDTILIPFSGTGTFAFEYLQTHYKFSSALFSRDYALSKMPLFNQKHFNFILKKAGEHFLPADNLIRIINIDYSKNAMSVFLENLKNIKYIFEKNNFNLTDEMVQHHEKDFFKMDLTNIIDNKNSKNIFMPLNPPYGIRIGKNMDAIDFYSKIASCVNEISKYNKKLLGFILCPDEKTWSHFSNKIKNIPQETYHFTQGGMDIRVCQFYKK